MKKKALICFWRQSLLLQNGASIYDLDDNGWGVLAHCLNKSGAPVDLIQLFIDSGADVKAEVDIELERVEAVNSSSSHSETDYSDYESRLAKLRG